jgi:hypothetical protein
VADLDAVQPLPRADLCSKLAEAAKAHNVPLAFFHNLIWQESRFDHRAVSPAGAQGVAQFMPRIAQAFDVENPFDPLQALPAAARMLRGLFQQFGNFGLAAAAYNAGSGRVSKWLESRKGKLPLETRNYVRTITGQPPEHWRKVKAATVDFKLRAHHACRGVDVFDDIAEAELSTREKNSREADTTSSVRAARVSSRLSAARERKAESGAGNTKTAAAAKSSGNRPANKAAVGKNANKAKLQVKGASIEASAARKPAATSKAPAGSKVRAAEKSDGRKPKS